MTPGLRATENDAIIVASSGVARLAPATRAAILAHERAHLMFGAATELRMRRLAPLPAWDAKFATETERSGTEKDSSNGRQRLG